ncbi:N-acetylglucosamine-6-phosphate deacetylase [Aliigemmobacter aestuarii]|uniref:N-acetylglucosamine-6-phosphate deacetylase n=1 Tax=Aliigemmobacter aestuarii TaxID=1445661 RepID=A0A4S3MPS2_9RHOB|nr:N-acetylglucosamine-6-phosphate deacetylase [Gemmobacter aestuarii]THD83755.1 N-acetylglucosamine-6-phosphate deacetylase [Gemmobacter aestuarii]
MPRTHVLTGARLFDGTDLHDGLAVVIEGGVIAALIPDKEAPADAERVSGILAPAFVDLQVNGGGGRFVGAGTTAADLAAICATHRAMGTAGILPTLITDTPEATARVIAAGIGAIGAPGFLGLHLEGPHLDPRRKGAHDPALIRPMTDADLARLCDAARRLPVLMVTLAPESATPDQIAALAQAGAIVSLGHTDCGYDTARAAFAAGARCATHLFNAMSQLGNREPGLVGAVMNGTCAAGLIADTIHVHPAAMRTALTMRSEGIFLVTDCMAFAGTDLTELELHGRRILRREGRLTLDDGTLAGADLTLPEAIGNLVRWVGIAPRRALAMASSIPAGVIGADDRLGAIAPGRRAELVLLDSDFARDRCWYDDGWHDA